MIIIGHRGVAGTVLENTRAGFKRAVELDLQMVELDVRKTKDDQLVVHHDASLERLAGNASKISHLTLTDIKAVQLVDGSDIITLKEALEILSGIHVIIEIKDEGCGRMLQAVLRDHPTDEVTVASFKLRELVIYQELGIKNQLYALEHTKPFDIIHLAKIMRLDGIGLNFWLLNPLTYFLCRNAHLDLYVYTVNNQFIVRLLGWLYPHVMICTDFPEKYYQLEKKFRRYA